MWSPRVIAVQVTSKHRNKPSFSPNPGAFFKFSCDLRCNCAAKYSDSIKLYFSKLLVEVGHKESKEEEKRRAPEFVCECLSLL